MILRRRMRQIHLGLATMSPAPVPVKMKIVNIVQFVFLDSNSSLWDVLNTASICTVCPALLSGLRYIFTGCSIKEDPNSMASLLYRKDAFKNFRFKFLRIQQTFIELENSLFIELMVKKCIFHV